MDALGCMRLAHAHLPPQQETLRAAERAAERWFQEGLAAFKKGPAWTAWRVLVERLAAARGKQGELERKIADLEVEVSANLDNLERLAAARSMVPTFNGAVLDLEKAVADARAVAEKAWGTRYVEIQRQLRADVDSQEAKLAEQVYPELSKQLETYRAVGWQRSILETLPGYADVNPLRPYKRLPSE